MRSVRLAALLFAVYGLIFFTLGSVISPYRVEGRTGVTPLGTSNAESARYVGSLACAQCHRPNLDAA